MQREVARRKSEETARMDRLAKSAQVCVCVHVFLGGWASWISGCAIVWLSACL